MRINKGEETRLGGTTACADERLSAARKRRKPPCNITLSSAAGYAGGLIPRRTLSVIWLITLLWPLFSYAETSSVTKIGYIDLKRLLDEAPQLLATRAALEQEFAPRDTALKAEEARLAALKLRYERENVILSKADADALKREIDALERSIKRTRDELRNELNSRAAAERDRVWQQINNTVVEFSREQNYDLVIPGPVIFASGRIDITEQVLERLKQDNRPKSKKP